jgi:hypothetical protein
MTGKIGREAHWLRRRSAAVVGLLLLAACQRGPKPIAPAGMTPLPASTVREWVAGYRPKTPVRYDLRWTYRTQRGAAKGRASMRVAPPDSLRFDFRGPFGKSGAAVVIGDSGLWSKPEGDFQDMLRSAPLFWAALGLPQPPQPRAAVLGLDSPERRAWRYAAASDTFDFVEVRQTPKRILGEMRRGGRTIGVSDATFDPAGTHVVAAQLDFPIENSRFNFTVDSVSQTEAFESDIWRQP